LKAYRRCVKAWGTSITLDRVPLAFGGTPLKVRGTPTAFGETALAFRETVLVFGETLLRLVLQTFSVAHPDLSSVNFHSSVHAFAFRALFCLFRQGKRFGSGLCGEPEKVFREFISNPIAGMPVAPVGCSKNVSHRAASA
jgi:hypothetical protein